MRVTTIGLEEQAWTPSRRAAQSNLIGACRAVIANESSATPNGGYLRRPPREIDHSVLSGSRYEAEAQTPTGAQTQAVQGLS
jgi:hypothetical protein